MAADVISSERVEGTAVYNAAGDKLGTIELLPRALDLHGVQPRGMVAGLLTEHLGRLLKSAGNIGQAEAPALSQGILHMVAASLAPQADSMALARPQLDELVLRRMGRYVEEQMADADLGAEHLCAAFQLSRSRVYRLLEPVGGPATFIREKRLSKAHELLAASDKHVVFKRLSSDCGFRSSSQFSRAFKEHFGYNAKELRAQTDECRALGSGSASNSKRSLDQWLEQVARPRVVA